MLTHWSYVFLALTHRDDDELHGHYNDVIISAMASQTISLTIVCWTVYSKRRSKETSKLRVTGLCEGNSPVTGEFPAQRASNAENVSTLMTSSWLQRNSVVRLDVCRSVNWVIIGSGNGLIHVWCQPITWISTDLLSVKTSKTHFNEIVFEIQKFSFKYIHLKMLSEKCQPFCPSLKVLSVLYLLSFVVDLAGLEKQHMASLLKDIFQWKWDCTFRHV